MGKYEFDYPKMKECLCDRNTKTFEIIIYKY
jgi:hypothetical protein